MPATLPDLDRLRPAGGKRSSKRDLILNVFLRQEGHLTADDLVDLIRREDHRISRATVYRTLQWMVDAGIARKVDFGEGRFRFEHSYRHPRHYHLICKTCNRSFEFLSSDIESLVEEVAAAQELFGARRASCRSTARVKSAARDTRRRPTVAPPRCSSRATRFASRLRPSEAGSSSTRGPRESRGIRAAEASSRSWPRKKRNISARSRRATRSCSPRIPSSSRGRRFSSSRARRTASSPTAPISSARASNDQQALLIGIRCERGSHRFFKRYGERFEDSEGKQIFLEFAEEEKNHLDLLIREYKALIKRLGRRRKPARARRARA